MHPFKDRCCGEGGWKEKARLVACGNYATTDHITAEEKTASGTDIVALRMMLRVAAHRGWEVGSLDVKGAFLLAPRRKRDVTVLKPPAVLLQKGVGQSRHTMVCEQGCLRSGRKPS